MASLFKFLSQLEALRPSAPVEHSRKLVQQMDVDPTQLDLQALGNQYGVPNLGPLSAVEEVAPGVNIPGGLSGPMTYEDMLYLKANPFDRDALSQQQKVALQQRMLDATTPTDKMDDVDTFNRYLFGMLSPNQPLTPNELEASVLRARNPGDIAWWANQLPWEPGARGVDPKLRSEVNDRLAQYFETTAKSKGGMGLKGTANYANIAEMASMLQRDPAFFRKGEEEDWADFMQRVSSQVPGMSSKVGSFSTVWQDPSEAAISAIDRHMARKFFAEGGMFPTKKAQKEWERNTVKLWNENPDNKKVRGFKQLMQTPGGTKHFMDQAMSALGARENKLRTAKGGFGGTVPEHLRQAAWVVEPEKIQVVSDAYRSALEANEEAAREAGLNLFGSQWMLWDDLRRRTEPHEIMFAGTEKLPPMSRNMLEQSRQAHGEAGYLSSAKTDYLDPDTGDLTKRMNPVRPTDDYRRLAYWGTVPGAAGLGSMATPDDAQAAVQAAIDDTAYMQRSGPRMEATPEAPEWVPWARKQLNTAYRGGEAPGMPEGVDEALLALEQGRTSGYLDNLAAGLEITDPLQWLDFLVRRTMK